MRSATGFRRWTDRLRARSPWDDAIKRFLTDPRESWPSWMRVANGSGQRVRLEELRTRLAAGLDDVQRQEIAQLLVARISVTADLCEDGTKHTTASITYRFPGAVPIRSGTGSCQP